MTIIFIPGLSNRIGIESYWHRRYHKLGIKTVFFRVQWQTESYSQTVARLDELLDGTTDDLIVVGTSAGGSLAVSSALKRPNLLAVNICGRLISGANVRPSLEWASRSSRSFRDSVETVERQLATPPADSGRRIVSLVPSFDEVVPISTMTTPSLSSKRFLSGFHTFNIGLALFTQLNGAITRLRASQP